MPSKKNNNTKPNGFILYANEIRNDLLREGYSIRNTADLISAASPQWQKLPEDEKTFFKEKAKWEWENRLVGNNKSTKQLRFPEKQRELGVQNHVDLVQVSVDRRRRERQEVFMSWSSEKAVLDCKFYFVSFVCLLEEPQYQPVEVAAVQFSLANGIERSWHKFVNPGKIPLGYRYKAHQNSEASHKIPIEGFALAEDTYTHVFDELYQFLSRGTHHIPPIYAKISDTERTEKCLTWLAQNAGRANNLKRIYELEGLILDLDAFLTKQSQNLDNPKQIATDLISSTIFDWDSGTRCKWHEENESKFCALGNVHCYSFCIANYFCENFDIPVTEKHLPLKRNEVCYTLIPSYSRSSSALFRSTVNESRDNIMNSVVQKLKIEADCCQKNALKEEEKEREVEQNRKWQSLRGIPDKPAEKPCEPCTKQENHKLDRHESCTETLKPLSSKLGKGRGRGIINFNLRRPGEAFVQHASPDYLPTFGEEKHTVIDKHIEDEKRWAGDVSSPRPSEAPLPPETWRDA